MDSIENYFIKAGYVINSVAGTYTGGESPEYWTQERVDAAASYQYAVYQLAAKLVRNGRLSSILDVGSGPPTKLSRLFPTPHPRIHLVDQLQTAAFARAILPDATFSAANLETIDIDLGETFELAICADVIEHLANPDPCLRFIRQHLRPNGKLVISTPERDLLRGTDCNNCPHPMHVREWNLAEFGQFLESRGWTVLVHKVIPQQRTTPFRHVLGQTLAAVGLPQPWLSCQVVVCAKH